MALHEDPSFARPLKMPPTQSLEDRKEILKSIRYVDDVIVYQSEDTFVGYLETGNYDVRFLGDDYKKIPYSGSELLIPIVFIDRSHGYSSTKLKNQILGDLVRI